MIAQRGGQPDRGSAPRRLRRTQEDYNDLVEKAIRVKGEEPLGAQPPVWVRWTALLAFSTPFSLFVVGAIFGSRVVAFSGLSALLVAFLVATIGRMLLDR